MMNPFKSKKGLGRGLSSLIGDSDIKMVNLIFQLVQLLETDINLEKILKKKV